MPTDRPIAAAQSKPYYALGWNVRLSASDRPLASWHTGSLPGTSTLLIRRSTGLHCAVLFNARISPQVDHLTKELEPLLNTLLDGSHEWPAADLFEKYGP